MKQKIRNINTLLKKHFGTPPRSERPPDPLDLLIATILSQNTNDKNSYRAFINLKEKIQSWNNLPAVSPKRLKNIIRIAGLADQKAEAILNLVKMVKKERRTVSLDHIRKLNDDEILNYLKSFKGIGTKTASCVLLFSLNRNVCPVDTHVHRVLNRIGIVSTKSPDKTFDEIRNYLPSNSAHSFHTNLIRLGREICKPARPLCPVCPLKVVCNFKDKTKELKVEPNRNSFMLLDNV
ncbi:MAG: endonuclease III [Ignavibacteriaceae bacterium]